MTGEPCRERRGDLAAVAIGQMDLSGAPELRAHLAGCPRCRADLAELRAVSGALSAGDPGATGPVGDPPPELGDRIVTEVVATRAARRRRRRARAAAALTAAALVVGVTVGLVAGLTGGDRDPELVPFTTSAAGTEGAFALERNEQGTAVLLRHRGLDPGATYWLWLADDADRRVSAGTFTGAVTDTPVILQSALPIEEAVRIWATDADDRIVLDAPVPR